MHVSALFVYPVKSLRGFSVNAAAIDELGIVGDRRFLVIDAQGQFLTQRAVPRMALVATALSRQSLILSATEAGTIEVPLQVTPGTATLRTVSVWKSEGLLAEDCGDAPAAWLSGVLGLSCRLVRIGPEFRRPLIKVTGRPGDVVAFTDAYPFMATSEASVGNLNDRLIAAGEEPVPMDRFRPSFVIANCAPFAEDTWARIRVGEIVMRAGGPCARCIITTTNQFTGERYKEPLHTLATYRRDPADSTRINFGQNLIHETKTGMLRVGDEIEVL